MSEIVALGHSQWELFFFDAFGEFWARRLDRQISDEEKGQGFLQVVLAYSADNRKIKMQEQDALEYRERAT
jgi:hypothetical protein